MLLQVEKRFKWVWADHGDDISRQYAGTGALKSGFTRTGKLLFKHVPVMKLDVQQVYLNLAGIAAQTMLMQLLPRAVHENSWHELGPCMFRSNSETCRQAHIWWPD